MSVQTFPRRMIRSVPVDTYALRSASFPIRMIARSTSRAQARANSPHWDCVPRAKCMMLPTRCANGVSGRRTVLCQSVRERVISTCLIRPNPRCMRCAWSKTVASIPSCSVVRTRKRTNSTLYRSDASQSVRALVDRRIRRIVELIIFAIGVGTVC